MGNPRFYTVGGTVQAGEGVYISRQADQELLELCREGVFAYVLTPRQMGKSSLMVQTAAQLQTEGVRTAVVDLQDLGAQVTAEQWYFGFLVKLEDQLELDTDVVSWWQERSHLGVSQRLTLFFREVLLTEIAESVVVFVDEIDSTLSLDFTDDFFIAIRSLYVNRAVEPEFQRLSFVLIGVATPGDLIRDARRTPFNVGKRIDLTDFTLEEVLPLATGLELAAAEAEQVLGWILKWTGGHPYLTQRLCQLMAQMGGDNWTEAEVDRLVSRTFLGTQSEQDNNLQFVRNMLTKWAPEPVKLLKTYSQVRKSKPVIMDEEQSLVKSHLKLSGVLKQDGKALRVRNRIYYHVFDQQWIRNHLPESIWQRLKPARPIIATLLIAFLTTTGIAIYADQQRLRAEDALGRAEKQTLVAQQQREEADKQRKQAEQQTRITQEQRNEANKQRKQAEQQTRIAQEQARIAEEFRQKAEQERLLAEEQTKVARKNFQIALARQLAAQGSLVENQPSYLTSRGVLFSVEAMRRFRAMGVASVDADQAIRKGLSLVGRLVSRTKSVVHSGVKCLGSNGEYSVLSRSNSLEIQEVKSGSRITILTVKNLEKVIFSPSGRYLGVLSKTESTYNIDLWEVSNGRKVLHLNHQGNSMVFSPDDQYMATTIRSNVVKVWEINTHKEIKHLVVNEPLNAVIALSSGAEYVTTLTEGESPNLRVLEVATGREQFMLARPGFFNFSLDGRYLATERFDQAGVKILEVATGSLINLNIQRRLGTFREAILSPNGDYIVPLPQNINPRNLEILSAVTGEEITKLPIDQPLFVAAFSRDGKYLAASTGIQSATVVTGIEDYTIQVWELASSREVARMNHAGSRIFSLTFSQDSEYLTAVDSEGSSWTWKSTTGADISHVTSSAPIIGMAFSPDGNRMTTINEDNILQVFEVPTRQESLRLEFPAGESVRLSQDSRFLAVVDGNNEVNIWEVNSKREITSLWATKAYGSKIALHPAGKYLAVTGDATSTTNSLQIWDIERGQQINFLNHKGGVISMDFSPDGEYIAVGATDGDYVWNLKNGKRAAYFSSEGRDFTDYISLSIGSQYLASASHRSGIAWIREVATGREISRVRHENLIGASTFGSDGNHLATVGLDDTVRVWETRTGQEIARVSDVNGLIRSVFSSDGKYLSTVDLNGTAWVWLWKPEDLIVTACTRLTRNLTKGEWMQFVGKDPYRQTCPNL